VRILVIDVGGTHIKLTATGREKPIKIPSGPTMTATQMVRLVRKAVADWAYDVASIGYPGPVLHGKPVAEPRHLGGGWVGCDFRRAFGCPVKVINDAAMQALGSYKGGRMLFLGLGTGLGSALIVDGVRANGTRAPAVEGRTYESKSRRGQAMGKKWRDSRVIALLKSAVRVDDVVGGGNAKLLDKLPSGVRLWPPRTRSSADTGSGRAPRPVRFFRRG
jgi:hypothetical protein